MHGQRHAAGVGTCGRVWGHVAGCGDMSHGWWQGVGVCCSRACAVALAVVQLL